MTGKNDGAPGAATDTLLQLRKIALAKHLSDDEHGNPVHADAIGDPATWDARVFEGPPDVPGEYLALVSNKLPELQAQAIREDGRGHFLAQYDNDEHEVTIEIPDDLDEGESKALENVTGDRLTFYIYRLN